MDPGEAVQLSGRCSTSELCCDSTPGLPLTSLRSTPVSLRMPTVLYTTILGFEIEKCGSLELRIEARILVRRQEEGHLDSTIKI